MGLVGKGAQSPDEDKTSSEIHRGRGGKPISGTPSATHMGRPDSAGASGRLRSGGDRESARFAGKRVPARRSDISMEAAPAAEDSTPVSLPSAGGREGPPSDWIQRILHETGLKLDQLISRSRTSGQNYRRPHTSSGRRVQGAKRGEGSLADVQQVLNRLENELLEKLRRKCPELVISTHRRRLVEVLSPLGGAKHLGVADIVRCYPSCKPDLVRNALGRIGILDGDLEILLGLHLHKGELHMGAACSSAMLELILLPADQDIARRAQQSNVRVVRHCDDFIVAGASRAAVDRMLRYIHSRLQRLGLRLVFGSDDWGTDVADRGEPQIRKRGRPRPVLKRYETGGDRLSIVRLFRKRLEAELNRFCIGEKWPPRSRSGKRGNDRAWRLSLLIRIGQIRALHPGQAKRMRACLSKVGRGAAG